MSVDRHTTDQITGELRVLTDAVYEELTTSRNQLNRLTDMTEQQAIRIAQVENSRRWTPTTLFTLTMAVIFIGCLVGLGLWGLMTL